MSASIRLRDNRFGKNALCFECEGTGDSFVSNDPRNEGLGDQPISGAERGLLAEYGKLSLAELAERANGALVDLTGSHFDEGDRKKQPFFTFHDDGKGFHLDTDNLMGVLRFCDRKSGASVQVEVLSRFDKGKNNFFLNYLLSKAFNCALGAEAVSAQRSPLLDILLDIVFVRRLGEASKAGLLRHYREFRNNDWNFKGSLDLARHIRENIPLMHGIAYRKREIDLDVLVNRMILMAALTVNRRHPEFFEGERDAADALRELRMGVTEERDLRTLLSRRDCREPVTHPFFREVWEPLRQIARMILEDEQWTLFSQDTTEDEVSGVVFDGSWLWEEYLAHILSDQGFSHCVKGKSPEGMLYSLRNSRTGRDVGAMFPDFVLKKDGRYLQIADAKYKQPGLVRNDRLQMIAYAHVFEAKTVRVIYPPPLDEEEEKQRISDASSEDEQLEVATGQDPQPSIFEDSFLLCRNSCQTLCRNPRQKPCPNKQPTVIQTLSFGEKIPDKLTKVSDFIKQMEAMEAAFFEKMCPSPQNVETKPSSGQKPGEGERDGEKHGQEMLKSASEGDGGKE